MTITVGVTGLKARWEELVARAEAGEEIIITRRRRQVATLGPTDESDTDGHAATEPLPIRTQAHGRSAPG